MSGVKKISVPSAAPVTEIKKAVRPDDVPFPSVKDLKAKFNTGDNLTSQQIFISNKEKQKRHSYAHGNSKVEITGPLPPSDNKRASKTPTTPTTPTPPTVLKVKTTPNSIFESNGIAAKQNGTGSPATTPTSPNNFGFQNQRSSVILQVQAGERVSTQQETVELRRKVTSDGSSSDSVRRITSQFNDLHSQTTTSSSSSVTYKTENVRKITQEVEKIEDIVNEREDDSPESGRRMSIPSPQFIQSMSEDDSADREEFSHEIRQELEEDHDDLDIQIPLNDDREEERPNATEQFEEYEFQDNPSEHEEARENAFEQQEERSEHENAYEHHEEHNEHHEEHNEHHEEHNEHHEEHNEHHEEHHEHHEEQNEHLEDAFEHHEEHNEHQENDYEHNENADENNYYEESVQHDIYSETTHEGSEHNLGSEAANELQEAEEVIQELIEHHIEENLNEHEE